MNEYESNKKAREEYGDCRLKFKIDTSDKTFQKMNLENIEQMQQLLYDVGVCLDITGGEVRISILPERYNRNKGRYAGRRRSYAKSDTGYYKYSDIVYMMQSMKDQDIANEIGMPIATYRRHKKVLKQSVYYNSLDLNRLLDKTYLDNLEGNLSF